MIDLHCHLDRYPDPAEIAAEALRRNVSVLAVTNLPSHFEQGLQHVRAMKNVRLALGLHPLLASRHERELPLFDNLFAQTSYIGEIGLDFTPDGLPTKENQLRVFRFVLERITRTPKLLSIHSRRAETEVLQILEEFRVKGAIFHWYSGPESVQKSAIATGHFFSVNPAMTRSQAGRRIIERIPHDQILTETDGPYCKCGSRAAVPWDVLSVEEHLSVVWGTTVKTVSDQIASNFRRLLACVGLPRLPPCEIPVTGQVARPT